MEKETIDKCCFCNGDLNRWGGHNAYPLKDGYCCDTCNITKVIKYRLEQAKKGDKK